MTARSKTALYADRTDLPPLVAKAVALANDLGFIQLLYPGTGRAAAGPRAWSRGRRHRRNRTGCGAGLAWMASAEAGPREEYGRSTTAARAHWLQHPDLFATEVRMHPPVSAILATRKAAPP